MARSTHIKANIKIEGGGGGGGTNESVIMSYINWDKSGSVCQFRMGVGGWGSLMKNLAFHSLLRWKITTSFSYVTYTFRFKRLGECTFWTWSKMVNPLSATRRYVQIPLLPLTIHSASAPLWCNLHIQIVSRFTEAPVGRTGQLKQRPAEINKIYRFLFDQETCGKSLRLSLFCNYYSKTDADKDALCKTRSRATQLHSR